ncbi:MAG: hypothetical protein ABI591_23600 [Kofleriaceae bacterium]
MKALALALSLTACGPTLVYSGHTPDRAHRVEVMKQGDAQFVVVDGVRTGGYRGVAVSSLTFSANSAHVAFAARRGDRWIVAADRHADAAAYDGIGEIVVADDGRVAYAAERAGRWRVVLDGHPGPPFDAILAATLQLTGHHLVYVARTGHDVRAVIDDVPGAAFDGIGQLVAGDHVAYAGRRGGRAIAVVDQAESPPCAAVAHLTIAGGRVAFAAYDGTAWRVVVDGEPGPAVTAVHAIVLDAAHVAYLARAEDHEVVVVVDGVPIAAAEHARSLTFTPHGVAYVEAAGDGEQLILDGQRGASFDEIGVPVFAGDRVAYAARRDRDWFVVIDGAETRIGTFASAPVFSHDGTHVGFTGRDAHGPFVRIDGRTVRFDLVVDDTFAFARDDHAWSVVAGDLKREQMFFATDRLPGVAIERVPLATKELYSAAAQQASRGLLASPDATLVRWSEAEATRRRP